MRYYLNRYKINVSYYYACMYIVLSHVRLCEPMNCSLPGSSIHGIFQAKILEWVAFPTPGYLPNPRIELRHLLHLLHWQANSLPFPLIINLNAFQIFII